MTGLSSRDEEAFRQLRDRLEGVDRADDDRRRDPVALGPVDPMLATTYDGSLDALDEDQWLIERKFDGTRLIVQHLEGELRAYTRRGIDRIDAISRTRAVIESGVPDGTVVDGEYVFLAPDGTSQFIPIHTTRALDDLVPVYCAFDILAADGAWVIDRPLTARKALLTETVAPHEHLRVVAGEGSRFQAVYDELTGRGEEGVMLKRRTSHYHPGVRSRSWRKVKAVTEADVLAVGYTAGAGARAETFGALVLSDGDAFIGKVGSGFSRDDLTGLLERFEPVDEPPFLAQTVGDPYTPIEPVVVTVRFQEITPRGTLRAPVFVAVKPDTSVGDVDCLR